MEEKEPIIWRKIEPNRKYRIWRKDYNGSTYYNIQVTQKEYDGTESKYYIPVAFKKGISVDNQTDIKIIKGIENLRKNKLDQYNPIFSYMITEFEIIENEEQKEQQAYQKYQDTLNENELEEEIKNAELPF